MAPFCGPIDRGRAGRAEERVRDVTGDLEVNIIEATSGIPIFEERFKEAASPVGRRAAADPEGDPSNILIDRFRKKLPGTDAASGDADRAPLA